MPTLSQSMVPSTKPLQVKGDRTAMNQCFLMISQLLDLHLIELWTKGLNGLTLQHSYKADLSYRSTSRNEDESKGLCEKSLTSPNNFYSTSCCPTLDSRLKSSVSFHLPRDNTNTDVFIVGYSTISDQVNSMGTM